MNLTDSYVTYFNVGRLLLCLITCWYRGNLVGMFLSVKVESQAA